MEKKLHYTMGFIGGFMGAYAILNRCDVFGNAQTANMIYIVMNIVGKNMFDVLLRLLGLLIYMSGIVVTVLWQKRSTKVSIQYIALAADAAAFIILGFLPEHMNNVMALYPIFLAASIQWNSFTGINGYSYSTIFSTNNIRQFTAAVTEYVCSKESRYAQKVKFFGGLIICYHLGVAVSCTIHIWMGIKGIWIGLVPVVIAMAIMIYKDFYIFFNSEKRFAKRMEEVRSNV